MSETPMPFLRRFRPPQAPAAATTLVIVVWDPTSRRYLHIKTSA